MKKFVFAALAASLFAGSAHADPEGVSGQNVGLEGAAKFVNVWLGDDVEEANFVKFSAEQGEPLTEEDYDGAM